MPISPQVYRDAMARLGAAVNVVTTDGPAGRIGFTASAVCSVTDDPPTLLVCVNRCNCFPRVIKSNDALCVNTLTARQRELSAIFAGLEPDDSMERRFQAGGWSAGATGAPVLHGAAVSFDCRIAQFVEVGTHTVFFCEVVSIISGDLHEGLIYYGRSYHRVAHEG